MVPSRERTANRFYVAGLTLALVLGAQHSQEMLGQDSAPVLCTRVQLTVEAVPAIAKPGDPITLKLSLKNTSSKAVHYVECSPDDYKYTLMVFREGGREAPRTAPGLELLEQQRSCFRRLLVTLEPGEHKDVDIEVTKYFNFAQPGRYYVRARGLIDSEPEHPNKVEYAFSNVVVITTKN